MAKRHVTRIELSDPAKKDLENLSNRQGLTQIALMSRMVEWFVSQDMLIQPAIMGVYPQAIKSEVAKVILKRIAAT